jgi:hypothetical protein
VGGGEVRSITGGEKVENLILKDIRLGGGGMCGRRVDSVSSTGRRQPLLQDVTMTTPCHCASGTVCNCNALLQCRVAMATEAELFEILDILKSTIFLDITPCSLLKVNRRFGETYRLYLQGRKISRARNQRESRWQGISIGIEDVGKKQRKKSSLCVEFIKRHAMKWM